MRRIAAFFAAAIAFTGSAHADDLEDDVVYIPMPRGEALSVHNPLGGVRVRGWDQPQVRIIATKRARTPELVDRIKGRVSIVDGKVDVATGIYFDDHTWWPLPQGGAAIDLTIDAPRGMTVDAHTHSGDVDAEGFRSGAKLTSEKGQIRAADITGPVDTRSNWGKQSLQQIHGRLAANGLESDVDLESVDGDTVDATVYKGQITAREVRTRVVRLHAIIGNIVYVGSLTVGGRYELNTRQGDVRLALRPVPFRLVADAPSGKVVSAFKLDGGETKSNRVTGEFRGGGPSLELVSAGGNVSLTQIP
jgi:hypothetical protein